MNNHPFHLVENRPWPLTSSIRVITILSGFIIWFYNIDHYLITFGILITFISAFQWWRDIIRESTFQGNHTKIVSSIIKWGIILFIISEIFFFVSFFWTFLHRRLSPNIELGIKWPPIGIKVFNPIGIPILNTIILLCSGISLTWRHQSILIKKLTRRIKRIIITITLGFYFSILQIYEYIEARFTIADSIYGSTFFISTGFHGIHVLIGTIFIFISILRIKNLHFSNNHHTGFEASAWYWHFVDVVWLFLYLIIYWWGR